MAEGRVWDDQEAKAKEGEGEAQAETMNRWPKVLSFLVGTLLIATGAVLGYCWYLGQGMPHAASAKGMRISEAALIFGLVLAGIGLVAWGAKTKGP